MTSVILFAVGMVGGEWSCNSVERSCTTTFQQVLRRWNQNKVIPTGIGVNQPHTAPRKATEWKLLDQKRTRRVYGQAYIWTRARADHRTTAFHFTSQGCSVSEGRSLTVRWRPMKWKFGARDPRTNETEAKWAFVGKPVASCFGDCGKTVASYTRMMDIWGTMLVCSSLTFVIICINKVFEC